jgi:hypothetical protein
MNHHHHHDKGPGFMPMHGRSSRHICDSRIKVKVRRQERRKCREGMRAWLGETEASSQ